MSFPMLCLCLRCRWRWSQPAGPAICPVVDCGNEYVEWENHPLVLQYQEEGR